MESKQFEKIDRWFVQIGQNMQAIKSVMVSDFTATRDLIETHFNLLTGLMDSLHHQMGRVEKRMEKDDAEVVTLRLALKRLEDEIEQLRSRQH